MEQERDEQGKWLPGTSGNPNGRPPSGQAFSDLLRKEAENIDPDAGLSNSEIIAKALIKLAKEGNITAIERYADRVDGKPHQSMEVTGNIPFPAVVGFTPKDYASSDTDTSTAENPDANQEPEQV